MRYEVERIQHPIGQGCFYEERHWMASRSGRVLRFVYDCGGHSGQKILNREIDRLAGCDVAGLFISHFHSDHVNGLKRLVAKATINNVFLPYLDDQERITHALDLMMAEDFDAPGVELIFNPGDFFGDGTSIIQVQASEVRDQTPLGDTRPENSVYFTDGGDLNNPITAPLLDSMPIFVGSASQRRYGDWYMKTFVPKKSQQAQQIWDALMADKALGFSGVVSGTTAQGLAKWLSGSGIAGKVKGIYDRAIGHNSKLHNRVSMCLYSGPHPRVDRDRPHWMRWHHLTSCCYSERIHPSRPGWMGTGDQEFKDAGIRGEFRTHYGQELDQIWVLLVPHHGSEKNYHPEIVDGAPVCHVIACGMTNHHGHPSPNVVCEILKNHGPPCLVTEQTPAAHCAVIRLR